MVRSLTPSNSIDRWIYFLSIISLCVSILFILDSRLLFAGHGANTEITFNNTSSITVNQNSLITLSLDDSSDTDKSLISRLLSIAGTRSKFFHAPKLIITLYWRVMGITGDGQIFGLSSMRHFELRKKSPLSVPALIEKQEEFNVE